MNSAGSLKHAIRLVAPKMAMATFSSAEYETVTAGQLEGVADSMRTSFRPGSSDRLGDSMAPGSSCYCHFIILWHRQGKKNHGAWDPHVGLPSSASPRNRICQKCPNKRPGAVFFASAGKASN
jgi:hypothetical protein